MNRIVLLFAIFITASCFAPPGKDADLYGLYIRLSTSVASNETFENTREYFSSDYLKEVREEDEKSLFLLRITEYITKVDSHYQKFENDLGCLTVNGFGGDGGPVSIHTEYKEESNQWRVNYMYLSLLENENEFVNTAICPSETEIN